MSYRWLMAVLALAAVAVTSVPTVSGSTLRDASTAAPVAAKNVDEAAPGPGFAKASGGPDAFGYDFIDSNEPDGPAYSWVDISASGTSVLLSDDNFAGPFSVGFNFPFYGADQTQFYIGSNGFISFGTGSSSLSNQCPLPNAGAPSNLIALMWDDLDPGDTSAPAYYQSFGAGSCPYGSYAGPCLVVSFVDYCHFPGGASCVSAGTFQAILFDSGNILLQFQDVGAEMGLGSTTGIENADGSVGLLYACNTVVSLSGDLAVLFRLDAETATADLGISKSADGQLALPGGSLTYTIDVTNLGPDPATDVVVTDTLPDGASYQSDSCGSTVVGSVLTWTVGELAVDAFESCEVVVTISDVSALENTATVTAAEEDPDASNNSSTAAPQEAPEAIPTAGSPGLALLAALIAGAALLALRRRLG